MALHHIYPHALVRTSNVFNVVGGRHPVIEAFQADKAQHFVQNDCHLGGTEPRIWVVTGCACVRCTAFFKTSGLTLAQSPFSRLSL